MGVIKASNLVIGKIPEPEPKRAPTPRPVYISNVDQSRSIDNIKEPSVVVNGKVKKISKKSAFLLDMLSLDD